MSFITVKTGVPQRMIDVNITILGNGLNHNRKETLDMNNPVDFQIGKTTYHFDPEAILITKGLFEGIKKKVLRGRYKEKYRLIYLEGNKEPLKAETLKSGLTARMVMTAKESRALDRGLNNLFSTPFTMRKLLFILLVIGCVFLAYLVATNQIRFPDLV